VNLKNNFGVGPRDWWWALHFLTLKIICCYNYNPHVVFDAITATNPYSSWGWKIVLGEFICPSLRPLGTDNYTFPAPFSVTGTFSPRNFRKFHVANVTKIYMTRTFAPGGESSLVLLFPGAKVPENYRPRERKFQGWNFRSRERKFHNSYFPSLRDGKYNLRNNIGKKNDNL